MRYLKMSALAAVAAGAVMACVGAGSASATELCSTTTAAGVACPAGQKVTGPLVFSLTKETSSLVKETGAEGSTLDTCKSSESAAEITNSGSSTETVTGAITKWTAGSCVFPHTTTLLGKIEIHKIAGTSNGTLTADTETRTTINTVLFGTCVYTVPPGKSIGDLTEGNPAILHINAVKKKTTGSAGVCPETSVWSATYTLTSPATTVSVS